MPLEQGMKASVDSVTRSALGSIESDGRTWNIQSGVWSADGTKLTTTTARTADPKVFVYEPYSDFDIQADMGFGDAVYVRYKDNSNWIRVTKHRADYNTPYQCNSYYVQNGYVACNPHNCTGSTYNYQTCTSYCQNFAENQCFDQCPNYYSYGCSCTADVYYTTMCACGANNGYVEGYSCNGGCYFNYRCAGCTYYACSYAGLCTQYYGGQYCASTCYATTGTYYSCNQHGCGTYYGLGTYYACGSYDCSYTSYYTYTCYDQCPNMEIRWQTCYTYYYPVYLRLEKYVAGVLTLVQEVGVGDNVNPTYVRVTGKGNNIQVFSSLSPATAHINQTIAENMNNNGYGVGRVGYGNVDSGNVLDNIKIKPYGQPG